MLDNEGLLEYYRAEYKKGLVFPKYRLDIETLQEIIRMHENFAKKFLTEGEE